MKPHRHPATRICGLFLVLALAAGCAARFERLMTQDTSALVGKDIHAAIAKLGYPAAEQHIAGDHIYRWGANGGSTALTSAVAGVAVTQVTPSGCTIDLVVNDANVVTRANWQGDRRACAAYQERLEE